MSDKEFAYLTTLGYTGTLADKRRAYYDDLIFNGGEPDIPITAEYVPNRELWISNQAGTTSQRLHLTYFTAKNTETVTTATAYTAGTAAAATPTVCQYGVYSVDASTDNLTLITQTTNDTTMFATINTAYPKAFDASWSKVAGRRYALALLVVTATTAPIFVGQLGIAISAIHTRYGDRPRLSGYLGSQTSIPSSVTNASVTASAVRFAFYLNG